MTGSPTLIDDAPERAEKFRDTMNFVENDQAILVLPQKESWLCKPVPVLPSLQVKIDRRGTLIGNCPCQGRFSNLTRPDDCHSGLLRQRMLR